MPKVITTSGRKHKHGTTRPAAAAASAVAAARSFIGTAALLSVFFFAILGATAHPSFVSTSSVAAAFAPPVPRLSSSTAAVASSRHLVESMAQRQRAITARVHHGHHGGWTEEDLREDTTRGDDDVNVDGGGGLVAEEGSIAEPFVDGGFGGGSMEIERDPIVTTEASSRLGGRLPLSYPSGRVLARGGRGRGYSHLRAAGVDDDEQEGEDGNSVDGSSSSSPYLTVLLPLLLVYVSNQWSRSSLYYLVDFSPDATSVRAMNVDLGMTQAEYGALASVAFTALFAVASLAAGNLADKSDRRLLTATSCAAWSLATLATALSVGYGQVLAARVAMGLACAFTTPAAYTLVRDLFPSDRAAFASSVYGAGVYLGGALSSLSILLDERLGWRGALEVIAAYGVACAAISFVALPTDPKVGRGVKDDDAAATGDAEGQEGDGDGGFTLLSDATSVLTTSPRVQWLFAASLIRFCSGLCIGVWSAPYFRLAFPDDASSYAVINALIVSLCGVTSGVAGGAMADVLGGRAGAGGTGASAAGDENAGRLLVPVAGSFLAAPSWWMVVHATTFSSAMVWLAVEYLVAECWFGPVVAVLQGSVGRDRGGTAQGMFTLTGALGNLAPAALGVLYGNLSGGAAGGGSDGVAGDGGEVLSNLLGVGVCLGYLLSSVGFALSARAGSGSRGGEADKTLEARAER